MGAVLVVQALCCRVVMQAGQCMLCLWETTVHSCYAATENIHGVSPCMQSDCRESLNMLVTALSLRATTGVREPPPNVATMGLGYHYYIPSCCLCS